MTDKPAVQSSELLPCPFCGSENIKIISQYRVECQNCWACCGASLGDDLDNRMIKAWNNTRAIASQRAEPQAVPDEADENMIYSAHMAMGPKTKLPDRCYREIWKAMLAAAPTPPTVSPWQPIETAPRDGTEIILIDCWGQKSLGAWAAQAFVEFERESGNFDIGFYRRAEGEWDLYDNCKSQQITNPKLWMPIAAAPKPEEKA